jgi:ferredoxin
MKKIIVDSDSCIRCGACVGISNEVFEFNDDGIVETKENNNILEKMDEQVKEDTLDALEGCPVSAIKEVDIDE